MAKGNPPLQVRLDADTRARWQAAADEAGYKLSEFVRLAVDAQITTTPTTDTTGTTATTGKPPPPPAPTPLPAMTRDQGVLALPSIPGRKRSYDPDPRPSARERAKGQGKR